MGGRVAGMFTGAAGKQRASAIAGPGHMYEYEKGYLTRKEQYEQLKEQGVQVRETTKRGGLMGGGPEVTTYQRLTKRPEGGEVWTELPKFDTPSQGATGPAYPQGRYKIVKDPNYVASTTAAAATTGGGGRSTATRYGGGYRAKTGMGTRATRKTLMGGGTQRQQYDYRS
jgi:hypothetical protein